MRDRGQSSVLGVILCLATVLVLVSIASIAFLAYEPTTPTGSSVAIVATIDPTEQTIALTHHSGRPLEPERLRLRISVNGVPIDHQPPIPFFAAKGFVSGPTGPFNAAYRGRWHAGTTATIGLASTNTRIRAGDQITIRLFEDEVIVERIKISV
ncbi:type IV pilin N-terminal domain-containing protein [Halocatena halophila]|uniref:type IV pilin N-terminal domain-containing protein n=1 Tax=Halocatena halophila TaxID=2814576 RepID=UPI002ED30243